MTEAETSPKTSATSASGPKRPAKKRVDRKSRVLSTICAFGGGLTLVAGMTLAAQTAEADAPPIG